MTFELSVEELDLIRAWYNGYAEQELHDRTAELFALLEKLGIEANHNDLWLPSPEHYTEEHRLTINVEREAIIAYRANHPDLNNVRQALEEEARQ